MSCDIGESTELILQAFCHFTYITAHSPTLPSLYLHHSSFSNPSIASPTSLLILQSFFRFSYVTGFSLTSPGEPPMRLSCFILNFYVWYFTLYISLGAKVIIMNKNESIYLLIKWHLNNFLVVIDVSISKDRNFA